MYRIENGSTPTIVFLLVDASDDESAEPGLGAAPTVSISKDGGAFAATTNAVAEISNGFYKVALTATETNTDGALALYASGTGTNIFRAIYHVETAASVTLTTAEHDVLAAHILKYSFTSALASAEGEGGTSPGYRNLMGVIAKEANKVAMSGATLQVYEDDDATIFFEQTSTPDATADPIVSLVPV